MHSQNTALPADITIVGMYACSKSNALAVLANRADFQAHYPHVHFMHAQVILIVSFKTDALLLPLTLLVKLAQSLCTAAILPDLSHLSIKHCYKILQLLQSC